MSSPRAGERKAAAGNQSATAPLPRTNLDAPQNPPQDIEGAHTVAAQSITSSSNPINRNVSGTALWLRRADQLLLGGLLIALLALLAIARWKLSGGGRTEIEVISQQPREYFYAIEINRASWVEWAQLDGIGEKLARRIVQDREDNGPFKSVSEISRVRGLGPKLIEKLLPFLRCLDSASEPVDRVP